MSRELNDGKSGCVMEIDGVRFYGSMTIALGNEILRIRRMREDKEVCQCADCHTVRKEAKDASRILKRIHRDSEKHN